MTVPPHATRNDPSKPLAGLRVLDFSHALAGPFCTLVLAEYGADIYKLESRDGGDIGRGWGPPNYGDQSSFFMGLNRGKFGISIDLKKPEGIELCLRLVETMDVFLENFRPGTMERLGLGYEAVAARNPRIIYCSISGYGQDGPSRNEPAMDLIVQSSSGLMSITGTEDGGPVRCGYSVADVSAGHVRHHGNFDGPAVAGQNGTRPIHRRLDVRQHDLGHDQLLHDLPGIGHAAEADGVGLSHDRSLPRLFGKDRDFSIAIGSEKLWTAFCAALQASRSRAPSRLRHEPPAGEEPPRDRRPAVRLFRTRPAAEWLKILGAEGIPCSLVRNLREVVEDPQSDIPRHVSDGAEFARRAAPRHRRADQVLPR